VKVHDRANPQTLAELPIVDSFEEYEQDPLGFLMQHLKEHHEIFRYSANIYFINQPDLIEQILTRTNLQFQIPATPFRQDQAEDRVADWMEKRHRVSKGLHRSAVTAHVKKIVALTENLLQSWRAGQTLQMHEQMKQLTTRITSSYFFGQDEEALNSLSQEFTDVLFKVFSSPFTFPRWFPHPNTLRMRSLLARLDQSICQLISKRQHSLSEASDLLSVLMQVINEHGKPLTPKAICEILVSLMIPSSRSTAAALSWIWFLLTENREVEQVLCQEIADVLGDRLPNHDDIPRLKYVESVVKEALRLYPPTWLVDRDVVTDCEVNGVIFNKGQKVTLSAYVVQRDPRFFPQPDHFLPERWLDETTIKSLPKYSYFPFGGGPRICLGASLAFAELVLITTTIARRFSFQLTNSTRVKVNPQIILIPENLKVVVKDRGLLH
jgi:cytochrome P450